MPQLRIMVDGDAEGGFIGHVHDGDKAADYHPPEETKTHEQAARWILDQHFPPKPGTAEQAKDAPGDGQDGTDPTT